MYGETSKMASVDAFQLSTWEERGGEYVRRLVDDLTFTPEQAAGIVGNLGYESRGFDALQEEAPMVPGSRGGFGVAQWTASRRREFEAWCKTRLFDASSDIANYGFLVHELRGAYKGFASRLRQTVSLEEACRLTHKEYETPSDVLDGSYRSGLARLDWARRALAGAQGAPPAPVAAVDTLEDIKAIQAILARSGRYTAAIDGLFGPRSRNALSDLLAAAGQPRV
jgi:hypothetical protein